MPDSVVPLDLEVLAEGWPTLVWCPVEVTQPSGAVRRYQLVLALHRQASDAAEPGALVGVVAAPAGTAHVYDALGDAAGALALAQVVAPDVRVEAPEPLHRRDGCTSAVLFDDRWQLTLYRHLDGVPQPDVELSLAVAAAAPEVVARPRAVWQRDGADLAVLRRSSARAVDGVELARRSLAELLTKRCPPDQARHDLRDELESLGVALGTFHVASAAALGSTPATGEAIVEELVADARRAAGRDLDLTRIEAAYGRLERASDLGARLRIHGDLHLGHVLHDRRGWRLVDIGLDPAVPVEDRRRPSSPLRDVAALLRSLRDAAALAVAERRTIEVPPATSAPMATAGDRAVDPELELLAAAWEERCGQAVVMGYTSVVGVHELLPHDRAARDALLALYDLDGAVADAAWNAARGGRSVVRDLRAVVHVLDPELTHRG